MPVISIGDLARTFQITRSAAELKSRLTQLGTELSSGQKSDLSQALAGDFGPLAGIERSLKAIGAYGTANTEAAGLFQATQAALGTIQESSQEMVPALLTAGSARNPTLIHAASEDARQKFSSVVSVLNTRVADRALFGGAATDHVPLASAQTMMNDLGLAVAGETTAAGVAAAVDAWFDDPGGGFETNGYLGSDTNLGPLAIADGEVVSVTLRADDGALRDTMKAFALGGLIAEGAVNLSPDEQAELVSDAAERMLAVDNEVTGLRAGIGAAEARIEDAKARNAAEQTAYELARSELVAADPYETATELQAVYSQIETLYTATARIAGLKFTDFMR